MTKGKMAAVYYRKHPVFEEGAEPLTEQELESEYSRVCVWSDIEGVSGLEKVYAAMQSHGRYWNDCFFTPGEANAYLKNLGLQHTSMSVGDLVKLGDELYVVAGIGFEKCGVWELGVFKPVDFGANRELAAQLIQHLKAAGAY